MKQEPSVGAVIAAIACVAASVILFNLFKPTDASGAKYEAPPPVVLALKVLEMKVECPIRNGGGGPRNKGTVKMYGVGPSEEAIKQKLKERYPECKLLKARLI